MIQINLNLGVLITINSLKKKLKVVGNICSCRQANGKPQMELPFSLDESNSSRQLGCNMGTGNSAVSQPWVPWVWVRFRNSRPEAVPQPVTAVSRVFTVL